MRSIAAVIIALTFAAAAYSQRPDDTLASANGHVIHFKDLSPATQKLVSEAPANMLKVRTNLYDQLVAMRLFQAEAVSRNITTGQVIMAENANVKDPTEVEIKAVFDANRSQLGAATLDQVRKQIVDYLRSEPQRKGLNVFVEQLKNKYKFTRGKDVNAANLLPADVIGMMNGKPLTYKEFTDFSAYDIFDQRREVAKALLDEVNEKMQTALGEDEAKALGIDASTLIAREITDKMKDYSDEERRILEEALYDRLYAKYKVQISYKLPAQPVETVTTDDSPANGPADAPVTIIMFSDFQCSHCAATHPVLKGAMAAYPGKIRFVVRDCPLEMIHENAYRSALAAYAAHQQGKFFEYTDILYKNQLALDEASLIKYASQINLNENQFELDFKSEKAAAQVKKDLFDSESIGVHGTPTIFINGLRQETYTVAAFKQAIDRALKK